MAEKVIAGLAATGYRPPRRSIKELDGKVVFYELPRCWAVGTSATTEPLAFTVFNSVLWHGLLYALTRAAARAGARLEVIGAVGWTSLPNDTPTSPLISEQRQRYEAVTAPSQYAELTRRAGRALGGFILVDPRPDDSRVAWLREHDVPYVVLGRTTDSVSVNYVDIDDEFGFATLVGALLESGVDASRIGHLRYVDDGSGPPAARRRGLMRGLGLDERALRSRAVKGGGVDAITFQLDLTDLVDGDLLQDRIGNWIIANDWQAVVADCDYFASLADNALRRQGRSTSLHPGDGDVVLASCDNSVERNLALVPWMTLDPGMRDWTEEAIKNLSRQLRDAKQGSPTAPYQSLVKPHLITGDLRDPHH